MQSREVTKSTKEDYLKSLTFLRRFIAIYSHDAMHHRGPQLTIFWNFVFERFQ
jgi:pterin-4a-carbinolamine dehydratase